jgi:hypothetical protein
MRPVVRFARSFRISILVFPALILFFVARGSAQYLTGSVVGTVIDQSGAIVPEARVTVTNERTGLTRQTVTDSRGHYRAVDLPEGTYTITVAATGFIPLKKTGVQVVIGQVNAQDLQLHVGSVRQTITVRGGVATLQTETADVHTEISSYAVETLPLNVYQNFQTVQLLAPGVVSTTAITGNYPNALIDTPDRSFEINSNGLPAHINNTRVDGATDLFVWLPDHLLIVPPAETIQEVNVQTASRNIERAGTAGGAVDVVTKSGTNQFHGELYAFNTNQSIDARNLFDHVPSPEYIINNDGFTLGGPIRRDKLFFFVNADGTFQRNNESYFDLIPPVNYRQGDFTSALGAPLFGSTGSPITVCTTEGGTVQLRQGMVFDPFTGDPNTGVGRCVYSYGGQANLIGPSLLNAGAERYWGLMPAPNVPGSFTATTAQNDLVNKVQEETRPIFSAKLDWNRTDQHTLWAKYMAQIANYDEPTDFGVAGGNGNGAGHQFAQLTTIGHTWALKPTLVLTGDLGFERMREAGIQPGYGSALGQTLLGIPGTNIPENDVRYSGLPGITISGFTPLGSPVSYEPYQRDDWAVTTSHDLTWMHGAHEFHMGFDATHFHLNEWQPEIVCCTRGNLIFDPDSTFLNLPASASNPLGPQMAVYAMQNGQLAPTGFTSSLGNSVAEFDIGALSEVQKSEQYIKLTNREWQMDWYFGDVWKVAPKLTVDLGVQYYHFTLPTRDGTIKMESYDPSNNTLSFGGVGGNPTNLDFSESNKLFAPHIGIAYRLRSHTVFRAGYGIDYDTLPLERPLRGFYPLTIGEDLFVPSSSVSRFLPYDTFQQGIPLIQNPDVSSGSVQPPGSVLVSTLAPGEFKRGYVQSWNATLEHRLPGQILLSVAYVGNNFIHELNGQNINAATLNGGSASQPLGEFGRFVSTLATSGYLTSHYNSLQVGFEKPTSKGLYFQGSYTYSKTIDYESDEAASTESSGLLYNCPPSPALPQGCLFMNRGEPSWGNAQVLRVAYVYQLPFGPGESLFNGNSVAGRLLGGWQVNGIFSAWTGDPLTVSQTNSYLNTPGTDQTLNFVGNLQKPGGEGPGQFWFSPNSFVPVLTPTLGNTGRGLSWLTGPGLVNMDMSLFRNFRFSERFELQMRLEADNAFNTSHFGDPNTTCTILNGACAFGFGQITSSYGQRIVMLGAKLSF